MGWDAKEIDELRDEVAAIPKEVAASLTWETAGRYVASDTLIIAMWQGASRDRQGTPYEALRAIYGLPPDESDKATIAAMLAALKAVEWEGYQPYVEEKACPSCGEMCFFGPGEHRDDCQLAAAIRLGEGK